MIEHIRLCNVSDQWNVATFMSCGAGRVIVATGELREKKKKVYVFFTFCNSLIGLVRFYVDALL